MVYRAALIGCGKIGSEFDDQPRTEGVYSHAGAYHACPDTNLVAVCDTNADKLQRCARKWEVEKAYQDASAMLAEISPDIVSICTPDETHYDLLREALNTAGVRAILAEKPIATNPEQAESLNELADKRGVLLAVNYTRRYSDSYLELQQCLRAGKLGEILSVSGYYTKGIIHNGTHWIDLAGFLIGEIVQVSAIGEVTADDDPTLTALIEFAGKAEGVLQGVDVAGNVSLFEMDILGTLGRVRITDSGHRISYYELIENPHHSGYRSLAKVRQAEGGLSGSMLNAVQDLVDCLTEKREPRSDGAGAARALRIACALRDAARSRSPVKFS